MMLMIFFVLRGLDVLVTHLHPLHPFLFSFQIFYVP
jgi:hypothetical protein